MRRTRLRTASSLAALALLLGTAGQATAAVLEAPAAAAQTDLVLLLDGSGSISAADWTLQLDGYAAALQDRVNFPVDGSVAVSVIQWSWSGTAPSTRTEVPLTPLTSAQAVDGLVAKVRAISQIGYSTNPGDAVRAGTDELLANGRDTAEWTLCMSTDGALNSGESLLSATTYAKASGVDRYGVVAIEDAGFTGATAVAAYSPYVFGNGTVTVARTTAEFTSLVSGCMTDPLHVEAIEVTQVAQDWDNSVPLLRARPTVVRAFLETTTAGDPVRSNGRLRGFAGGAELPGSPLTSLNPSTGVLVDADAVEDRSTFDDSLNFALPMSWTAAGTVELAVELPGGVTCDARLAGTRAQCSETVSFRDGVRTDVEYRGISFEEDGAVVEPTFADLQEQHDRFVAQFPTTGSTAGFEMLTVGDRPTELVDVNEALQTAKELTDAPGAQRWYGLIPGFDDEDEGGLASGRVSSGFAANLEDRLDSGHSRNRVVHELGHSYGLHHSVNAAQNGYTQILWVFDHQKKGWCGEVADDSAPDYPDWTTMAGDPVAALGPVGDPRTEIWGIDPRYVGEDEDLALSAPQGNTSLMSYCVAQDQAGQARWIGKRDYLQLLDDDHEPISDDPDAGTGLAVRGTIAADGLSAELKPALAVDVTPSTDDPTGTHAVVLLDAAGAELSRTRFTPIESHGEPASGGDTQADPSLFNVVVPAGLAGLSVVQVRKHDAVLAAGTVSSAPPQVSVPAPRTGTNDRLTLGWSSADTDGDALLHTVLYSADDGRSWSPVAVDVTGPSVSVARRSLPGSATARVRVIASDGLRSSVATSPAFALPNLAPAVDISSPADGLLATGAQSIPLSAAALDAEDGRLDASVVWRSDRNGALGTGGSLVQRADLLAEGRHVITATVTDSGGASSSASVTIDVQRVATAEPPASDYVFGGFTPPVSPDGTVTAGRTIPIRWTVSGADLSDSTVVSAAFTSEGATYDLVRSGGTWHLNAATPKEWAGSTRTFRVVLDDLSVHEISLAFR